MKLHRIIILAVAVATGCASIPEDTVNKQAALSGESTIVVAACGGVPEKGWTTCLVQNPSSLEPIQIAMTNPGEWAVSDCSLNVFKQGHVELPGIYTVPIDELAPQLSKNRFCILKVETVEHFGSPTQSLYQRGGVFFEVVDPGYFAVPGDAQKAFCLRIDRTTKGRTIAEPCSN